MTASWKSGFTLFCFCSLLCEVVTGELQLEPLNLTVLQGSNAQFNATVQGDWQVMTWTVQGFLVLTVPSTGDIVSSSEQFSAKFCSSSVTACVEFTIHNVTRRDAGPVTCTVQGNYTPKTAQLYVQESGRVVIMGGNVTARQDQQVELQCVTTAWYPTPAVSWSRNGEVVDSSLYNTTSVADEVYFNSSSILKFQAVSNTVIECRATVPTLKTPQSSSVFMTVVPRPPDWTVLIAVVVSFGSCALLVLLIFGILFCYKRKKANKPNYQDEMRRARTHSQLNDVNAAGERRGQINPSYLPEGQTGIPASSSGVFQKNGFGGLEMPDGANHNQAGNGSRNTYSTVGEPQVQKHRHITIV